MERSQFPLRVVSPHSLLSPWSPSPNCLNQRDWNFLIHHAVRLCGRVVERPTPPPSDCGRPTWPFEYSPGDPDAS
jgi:hypothetical protein